MKRIINTFILVLLIAFSGYSQTNNEGTTDDSQWNGKRVAFLGDSMTDPHRDSSTTLYWMYLQETLSIEPLVYGINGHQWNGIYKQALKLNEEHGTDLDAILIFAGTNDYNDNLPLGQFYTETAKKTNHDGIEVIRKHRTLNEDDLTFCGRINKVMAFLKANYPDQQIIIMTPIHRGFAKFGDTNIQPEESFSNSLGLFLDDYVNVLKQASSVWSVPVIDLYSTSGLYPMEDSNIQYFVNAETDMLHPNTLGNYRLAKTIHYQLLSLPSSFIIK